MADTDVSVSSGPTPTKSPMGIGSELCTQCGLCCTGALHDTVLVRANEAEAVRSLGFDVFEKEEKLRFRLPCGRLSGSQCSIYDQRPSACGRYECGLLQRVKAGETSLDQALETVEFQKALIERALALMPVGSSFGDARALAQDTVPDHFSNPELLLRIIAAMRFVDHNFRHREEGPLLWEDEVMSTRRNGQDERLND